MYGDEFPEGWASATIADLCTLNPRHDKAIKGSLPVSFVPMASVSDELGEITEQIERPLHAVRKGYTHFADGDVLWAKITPCMQNGKSAVARGLVNGLGCGTTEFYVLRSKGNVLPDYLHQLMRQSTYLYEAERTLSGAVGQARVPKTFVLETEVPLPPLPEQRRIVARLDAIEAHRRAAKERLDALPERLDQYRQSVLAAAFRGDLTAAWRAQHPDAEPAQVLLDRIRAERRRRWIEDKSQKLADRAEARDAAKGHVWADADRAERLDAERARAGKKYAAPAPVDTADLPDLPDGWQWASVNDVSFIDVGFAFSSKGFSSEGVKLVRGANVAPGRLDWSDVKYWPADDVEAHAHLALAEGDTVLAMDRPMISTGLKLARVTSADLPAVLVQRVARFNMVSPSLGDLLHYSLSSLRFIGHLTSNQTGSDLPHVSAGDIGAYPIPIPPAAELDIVCGLVAESIARIDALAARVDERSGVLDTLRQATLARAFRGELVPTDAVLARSGGLDAELDRMEASR